MAESRQTYEVQLAGMPLKLKSSHGSSTVNELVHLVNEKIQDALKTNPNIPFQKALLLASLHIAEDLVFLRKTAVAELDQLEAKAQEIISDFESSPISRIRLES